MPLFVAIGREMVKNDTTCSLPLSVAFRSSKNIHERPAAKQKLHGWRKDECVLYQRDACLRDVGSVRNKLVPVQWLATVGC
jgi:hypothetical protein